MTGDCFGIVCNLREGTPAVAPGALCWVCRSAQDPQGNVQVRVRSRGGRWIVTFFAEWKLDNFRAKWLPPTTTRRRDALGYLTRDAAEEDALRLDRSAREERSRRNVCDIERKAGLMDAHGRRA